MPPVKMFIVRGKTITVFFLLWLSGGGLASAQKGTAEAVPFIWWSEGVAVRLISGRVEQVLTLEVSPAVAMEKPEAWLRTRISKFDRLERTVRTGESVWSKGDWSSCEPYTLVVQSGVNVTVDVFARAEIEGRPYFAQTRIILYGRSGETEENRDDEAPDLPEFTVRSNGESYWPQTGHEFTFDFKGEKTDSPLEVRGGRGELLDEIQSSEAVYKYTAPHDPDLNLAGRAAFKPLIFVFQINGGGTASYTQIVHRPRHGYRNMKAGLGVLTASFLLAGLAVAAWRKRGLQCV